MSGGHYTLDDLREEWMKDPEFARAYRWVRFWWPLTSRIETVRYWLAYWLARVALSICDYGVDDGVDDWWKAYCKRTWMLEDDSDD